MPNSSLPYVPPEYALVADREQIIAVLHEAEGAASIREVSKKHVV